ncbi:MAG: DUF2254 domain-containing protein [Ilumatobacteraceae bacterium]
MGLRLSSWVERLRASFFLLPVTAVVVAIGAGLASVAIDGWLDPDQTELPLGIGSTVESARALLGTIAGATITFAGIAFSISLLVIQLASSQHSPRVTHTLFRDPFITRVIATVVGTFTYCLIVLRSVRTPLEEGGDAVIPHLSVAIAVVLGIVAILAVVALIDHNAHAMDISEILDRVTRETVAQIRKEWPSLDDEPGSSVEPPPPEPGTARSVVRFDRSGWVQQIDTAALLRCDPEGATIVVASYPGRFAVEGAELASISDAIDEDGVIEGRLRATVAIGKTRTMQQDVSYGLRQVVDVALRALSPGVNDPTTAQDAIFHSTVVLAELLRHQPPPSVQARDAGGWLILPEAPTHHDLVELCFDEVRRAAAPHPAVCIYLLEALRLLHESTRSSDARAAIRAQARYVVAGCAAAGLLPTDLDAVRAAHGSRFERNGPLTST